MDFLTLDGVQPGTRIFIDAPIFIYHFTGASAECRAFLGRCESGDLQGVTSTLTLAEVTHRLMMVEAVMKGLVSPGNVVKKLRQKPDAVRKLGLYQEQVGKIALMQLEIATLDSRILAEAGPVRRQYGLLTNDSLALTTARGLGISAIASADQDFVRIKDMSLFCPRDL